MIINIYKTIIRFIFKPISDSLLRTLTILFVVIQPVIHLIITAQSTLVEWQSGKLHAYLGVFISHNILWIYTPFILFSIISALLFVYAPQRFGHRFIIHVGIYSGLFLSVFFTVIGVGSFANGITYIMLLGLGMFTLIILILKLIDTYIGKKFTPHITTIITCIAYTAIVVTASILSQQTALIILLFIIPFVTISVGIFIVKKLKRYTTNSSVKNKTMSWILYDILFGATTYIAIQRMFFEYSKLPKNPPQCYIATAAAHGHAILTRSTYHYDSNNNNYYAMNDQVIVLKSAELILKTLSPTIHTWLRKHYNNYGQRLAKKIHNPFIADIIYISLIPITLFMKILVKYTIPNYTQYIKK